MAPIALYAQPFLSRFSRIYASQPRTALATLSAQARSSQRWPKSKIGRMKTQDDIAYDKSDWSVLRDRPSSKMSYSKTVRIA
jgi:hypothetical protein